MVGVQIRPSNNAKKIVMLIRQVIELLQTDKFYNVSENVEIAKGKYAYMTNTKKALEQVKRIVKAKY